MFWQEKGWTFWDIKTGTKRQIESKNISAEKPAQVNAESREDDVNELYTESKHAVLHVMERPSGPITDGRVALSPSCSFPSGPISLTSICFRSRDVRHKRPADDKIK